MVGGIALKSRRSLEEVVPYVWQLVLAQVSVEGGVLHTDEHGLFDGPGMAVDVLVHYVNLVWVPGVFCSGAVVVYGGGALKCSLTLSPKDLPDSPMYALGQFMWEHW